MIIRIQTGWAFLTIFVLKWAKTATTSPILRCVTSNTCDYVCSQSGSLEITGSCKHVIYINKPFITMHNKDSCLNKEEDDIFSCDGLVEMWCKTSLYCVLMNWNWIICVHVCRHKKNSADAVVLLPEKLLHYNNCCAGTMVPCLWWR